MATRKLILDNNNNEILPITDTDAVRNPQSVGGTLESRISNIEKAIEDSDLLVEQNSLTDQQRNIALANISNQTANSTTGKMGYKVLDPTKTFAQQVTAENTIYEIRDVFDLGSSNSLTTIIIPTNCTLKFNGGTIKNGDINLSQNVTIQEGLFYNCRIKLNGNSCIRNSSFNNDNNYNSESVIQFTLSDYDSQPFNITLDGLSFITGTTRHNCCIKFYADIISDSINAAGGYNINISSINIRGRFINAILFDGIAENSWFTAVNIKNVFVRQSNICINIMPNNGKVGNVNISEVTNQYTDSYEAFIKLHNANGVSLHNAYCFDSGNLGQLFIDAKCANISVSGNSTINRAVCSDSDLTFTEIMNIGSTVFINTEDKAELSSLISLDTEATIKDFALLPNGLYYIENSTEKRTKLLNNWGILCGDSNASEPYVIIRKQLDNKMMIIECFSESTSSNAKHYSVIGLRITGGTYGNLLTPIKDLWITPLSDYIKTTTQFNRLDQLYEGMIVYRTSLKKCILYNGTAWVNLDGTALS